MAEFTLEIDEETSCSSDLGKLDISCNYKDCRCSSNSDTEYDVDHKLSIPDYIPPELWSEILLKLDRKKDLKNVSSVCRTFYDIVKEKLWCHPHFKSGMLPDDLRTLNHLPIKIMNTEELNISSNWLHAICTFSQLTTLRFNMKPFFEFFEIGKIGSNLRHLKSLTLSRLSQCAEIGKAMSQLEGLQLEHFSTEDCLINPYNVELMLKSLGKMSTLRKLEMRLSDTDCKHLHNLSNLAELVIWSSRLTVSGLKNIATMSSLQTISLCNCHFTFPDAGSVLLQYNPILFVEWIYDVDCEVNENARDSDSYDYLFTLFF